MTQIFFHMGGGRLGWSYLPCRIPSSFLFLSHICACPCYHVLTSAVCIISSGLFNTCMLHNLTTQGEERNIGSVQDILLKLRHNFMAFFCSPPPPHQSLSLSLSNFLRLHSTHKIDILLLLLFNLPTSLSTWMRIL